METITKYYVQKDACLWHEAKLSYREKMKAHSSPTVLLSTCHVTIHCYTMLRWVVEYKANQYEGLREGGRF